MGVTFITVAVILSVVFTVLLVDARDRVRAAETEKLQVGERAFSRFEAQRQRDQLVAISALSENSSLKAALDTYFTERESGTAPQDGALQETVAREVERLATIIGASVVAALDPEGRVFASGGAAAARWPAGLEVRLTSNTPNSGVAIVPSGAFRYSSAPLLYGDRPIGSLVVATSLDKSYAEDLSRLADAGIVITVNDLAVAGTVGETLTRAVMASASELRSTMALGGEEYAIRTLMALGSVRIYMLSSIDAVARSATRSALIALGTIALWAFVLAAFASRFESGAHAVQAHEAAQEFRVIAIRIEPADRAGDQRRNQDAPAPGRGAVHVADLEVVGDVVIHNRVLAGQRVVAAVEALGNAVRGRDR